MPLAVIKDSLNYCLKNKLFFLLIIVLFLMIEIITDIVDTATGYVGTLVFVVIIFGYGLQIIEDIINGGTRLPKIMPKKVFIYGIKGFIVWFVYIFIQLNLLSLIADLINFPVFEIEELFLNYNETLSLLIHHDIHSFIIFVISVFVISYVVTFFMELSLARLADGGQLRKSFNLLRIKHAIDIIGWKRYTIEYTKIITVIIIFSFIGKFSDPYQGINIIIGTLAYLIEFTVEFLGMGNVYKVYTHNKKDFVNS